MIRQKIVFIAAVTMLVFADVKSKECDEIGQRGCDPRKCKDMKSHMEAKLAKRMEVTIEDSFHVITCKNDGEKYDSLQCSTGIVNFCWKVDENTGEKIPGCYEKRRELEEKNDKDVFIPTCNDDDNSWAKTQCKQNPDSSDLICYCADSDGNKLTDFSDKLNTWNACEPKRCDLAKQIYELKLAKRMEVTIEDSFKVITCKNDGEKYDSLQCSTGIVNFCWEVDENTGEKIPGCYEKRRELEDKNDKDVFIPTCNDNDNSWAKTQCKLNPDSDDFICYCADSDGNKLTDFSDKLNTLNACEPTSCSAAKLISELKFNKAKKEMMNDVFHDITCQKGGVKYTPRQCNSGIDDSCWVVDENTGEIIDTWDDTQKVCKKNSNSIECYCTDSDGYQLTGYSDELNTWDACISDRCDKLKVVSRLKKQWNQKNGGIIILMCSEDGEDVLASITY